MPALELLRTKETLNAADDLYDETQAMPNAGTAVQPVGCNYVLFAFQQVDVGDARLAHGSATADIVVVQAATASDGDQVIWGAESLPGHSLAKGIEVFMLPGTEYAVSCSALTGADGDAVGLRIYHQPFYRGAP